MLNKLHGAQYKIYAAALAATFCFVLCLCACQASDEPGGQPSGNGSQPASVKVLTPDASGVNMESGGGATLDYSNSSEGYVMAKATGGKTKVQIAKQGGATYTYDLRSDGLYETYPLTDGNGTYTIGIFKNVTGNQYAQSLAADISVNLNNAESPFLYPNQFVNFSESSKTVAKGAEISGGAGDDLEVVSNIYNYVIGNITYDTAKAKEAAAGGLVGYVPDVDAILESQTGICFDYAAVMTAMLRTQGIPTRLEVGYVSGGAYHAWISVYITDIGWVNDVIQFDGNGWILMDPTFASAGGSKYVGDGTSYSTQFIY